MPKSYLKLQPLPKRFPMDWLSWSTSTLEANIAKEGTYITGIMGINKAGDLQSLFMPKIVPRAFSDDGAAIIGNSTDLHIKPSFVFTNTGDLGFVDVIENFSNIPNKVRPQEHLSSKFLKSTSWDKAKVPLGLALIPIIAPIFFGQKHIKISIHDADFEDKLESVSQTHLQWVKLMKEHVLQQEKDGKDIITIFNRLFGKVRSRAPSKNFKFTLAGFLKAQIPDSSFFPIYNFPKDKWKDHQSKLRVFFVGNPSPNRQPHPPAPSPPSPVAATTAPIAPPINLASQPNLPQTFDPIAFMQQFNTMLALQQLASQQPQTIVVESRANKCRDSKAKFNNNMLQLLLIGGEVVLLPPASFDEPRIPTYTQAMKNILAMPTSIRAIQAVNILLTVFAEIPLDMAERLSPLITLKFLLHISKNFVSALLSCNVQRTGLDSMNFETSSITILNFVKQSDKAKLKAHCEAEQITKNMHEFDFIKSHRKALKTTIKGLGKITSMECIVKIWANVCCVITAFFDIRPGNPVPLLYSICIKTIEFIKNLDFIRWHAEVREDVPQPLNIFLNMLHKVLSQFAIFSTDAVNNNLVERGDNGSNLIITSVVKITKFFLGSLTKWIITSWKACSPTLSQTLPLEMQIPNTKPQMLFQLLLVTVQGKSSPKLPPLGLPLAREPAKSRRLKPLPEQRTSPRPVSSVARKESRSRNCFLLIS
jgi:hypothetical protein